MKKFEVKKIEVIFDFTEKAKELGLQGWQLITVCLNHNGYMVAFFQREIL
jgi:hypothetical protein